MRTRSHFKEEEEFFSIYREEKKRIPNLFCPLVTDKN